MSRYDVLACSEFKLAMLLKMNQLQREELQTLSYSHILKVLQYLKWDKKKPMFLHEAIHDVFTLEVSEIIASLHLLAVIEGSTRGTDAIDECWRELND